jgi:hypothetical protein
MYAAKGSGRDRVRIFDSTTPEPQRGAARVGAGVGTRA